MPAFETLTLSLPTHWMGAIMYGDAEDLELHDALAFQRWLKDTREDLGHGKSMHVGTIKDQPYFARYHDAAEYGVSACMCVDVDLLCEV
jgi:hypothetical protein